VTIHIKYVHGFRQGDADKRRHPFFSELTSFCQRHRLPLPDFWRWNSPSTLSLDRATFLAQVQETEQAGGKLHETIREHEAKGEEYHLIGFSLGTAVIRHAIGLQRTEPLKHLRTLFFLGAAFPHDAEINDVALSQGTICYNYYSSAWSGDKVLQVLYRMATGKTAAGEVGLHCSRAFCNYAVRCTHGMGIVTPRWMAEPIGYLIAWHGGTAGEFHVPGDPFWNVPFPINMGWRAYRNDILQVDGHLVQQVFFPTFPLSLPPWYLISGSPKLASG